MADSVKIMKRWFDQCQNYLDDDQLDILYAKIIKYGLYDEDNDTGDPLIDIAFGYIKPQVDNMQAAFIRGQDFGNYHGRKPTFSEAENEEIYELKKDGMTAKDIGDILGIDDPKKVKAIYNSEGWKKAVREGY